MDFKLTKQEKRTLSKRINKARKVTAPENSLGQWIGYIIDNGTSALLEEIILTISSETKRNFTALSKKEGKSIRLKNTLGQLKEIDHVIEEDDVFRLIVESKWLKDQRHLNDKGAWILMMGDILLENKNLKGICVVLAGPWESMRNIIEKRAEAVIVPTEKVYDILSENNIDIPIDKSRNAFQNPRESLGKLLDEVGKAMETNTDFIRKIGYQLLKEYTNELSTKISKLLL